MIPVLSEILVEGIEDEIDEDEVDEVESEDNDDFIDGTFIITGGWVVIGTGTGTGTGADVFCVSLIILDASVFSVSICFWVVSSIFDSTIASYNLTPLT